MSEYFILHRGTQNGDGFTPILFVDMSDKADPEDVGAICSGQLYFDPTEGGEQLLPYIVYPDPIKDGWERALYHHLRGVAGFGVEVSWALEARVLCAIIKAVEDLEERHLARAVVLDSTIRDIAEDTLVNLVPSIQRPAGSFPVFEALGKVLEAIDICEAHL
jgi:hypothetical protein